MVKLPIIYEAKLLLAIVVMLPVEIVNVPAPVVIVPALIEIFPIVSEFPFKLYKPPTIVTPPLESTLLAP